MATAKFYLDKRATRWDGKFPLKISIAHKGKTSLISLDIFLMPEQWDERAEKIIGVQNRLFLNTFIAKRKLDVETALLKLLDSGKAGGMGITKIRDFVMSEISPEEKGTERKGTFVTAFRKFIGKKDKPRTKELYELTLSHLYRFCPDLDRLNFEDVTKDWLMSFDAFMAKTAPSRNARNIYLRNIRAVFNDAIDDEVTTSYPFRKFKIKGEATVKRSLTPEQLRMIFGYPVEEYQEKYRDMFKLIFLLIGINTVDLFNLKASDMDSGRIYYRRAKTGRLYDIKIEPEAKEIIERYRGKDFLLDVGDRYRNYRDFAKRLNDNLQLMGETKTGKQGKKTRKPLFPKITTYWARHSWATVAASLDIPKETIAAALGHGGNTVTDIYIDFDRKKVDEANRRVIDRVLYGRGG